MAKASKRCLCTIASIQGIVFFALRRCRVVPEARLYMEGESFHFRSIFPLSQKLLQMSERLIFNTKCTIFSSPLQS